MLWEGDLELQILTHSALERFQPQKENNARVSDGLQCPNCYAGNKRCEGLVFMLGPTYGEGATCFVFNGAVGRGIKSFLIM